MDSASANRRLFDTYAEAIRNHKTRDGDVNARFENALHCLIARDDADKSRLLGM